MVSIFPSEPGALECGLVEGGTEYSTGPLEPPHREQVLEMVSRSFADKGDLTTLASVSFDNIRDQLDTLWTRFVLHQYWLTILILVIR